MTIIDKIINKLCSMDIRGLTILIFNDRLFMMDSSLLPPEKLKKLEGPGLAAVELAGTVDRDYNSHMNIKSFFLLEMP